MDTDCDVCELPEDDCECQRCFECGEYMEDCRCCYECGYQDCDGPCHHCGECACDDEFCVE